MTNYQPRVFLFHRDGDLPHAPNFLVSKGKGTGWDIPSSSEIEPCDPEARTMGYYAAFSVLDNGLRRQFTIEEQGRERSPEDPSHSEHLWVSYKGLCSVLEYKGEAVQHALGVLDSELGVQGLECSAEAFDQETWSVLVVKPDAKADSLEDEILERVHETGLSPVLGTPDLQLSKADVERIWTPPYLWTTPQPAGDWWHETVAYMCEGPVSAHLVYGDEASVKLNQVKADLRKAHGKDPHKMTNRPASERVRSLMHCSDRTEELVRNADLFWPTAVIREVIEERAA